MSTLIKTSSARDDWRWRSRATNSFPVPFSPRIKTLASVLATFWIYVFVDDQFDSLYRAEERLGQLFGYFTALAIVIGCLGLFGLTSFTAEQRPKEIGIRKVFGASVWGIIMLLVREFTKWVFLAVVIAWPIGYFVMKTWLQNFHYRISLGFDTFMLAALLALIIAVITVSYQSIRAALANPADSLKYE